MNGANVIENGEGHVLVEMSDMVMVILLYSYGDDDIGIIW